MKDQLLMRLKPMRETHGLVECWHDRCIAPGEDWDREIRMELEASDVNLLLVSPEFLESDYVRGTEMKLAVERANSSAAFRNLGRSAHKAAATPIDPSS